MTDKLNHRISEALVKAGYTNPRTGEPSVRALTRELELNNSRVSRYLHHGSKMQLEARQQVAAALDMDLSELDSLVAGRKVDTYSPPANANLLDHRERTLINEMINLLAERHLERKAVGNDADSSASMNDAGETPAVVQDGDEVGDLRRRRAQEPHRRRRPGHDPEWDALYGDRAATYGEEGIAPDEIPDDTP